MPTAQAIIADKSGLDPNKHRQAIEQALDNAAALALAGFQSSVSTWEHKPEFTVTREPGKRTVATNDPQYGWINNGTAVRYATMTPDFLPKTKPGFLGSGTGRGGVLFVNRNRPRPGIEARRFDQLVLEQIDPQFASLVQAEINRAVGASAPTGILGRIRAAIGRLFGR